MPFKRIRPVFLFIGFFALTTMLYILAKAGGFVLDDWSLIVENPALNSAKSPLHFWTTFVQADYWPLSYTCLWVMWNLFGRHTEPYHWVNFVLHAMNGAVLFFLLREYKIRWPLFWALLFLVHPVQVESVAWIFQMKTLMATFFCLLAWWIYMHGENQENPQKWQWAAAGVFLAGVLSKTSIVALPVILLLEEFRRGASPRDKKIYFKVAPFFVLSLLSAGATLMVSVVNTERGGVQDWAPTFAVRMLSVGQSVWIYLKGFLLPIDLCFLYGRGQSFSTTPEATLGWLVFGGITLAVLGWGWRGRQQLWVLGGLVYALGILPALGFITVPYMRYSPAADHWQYLSTIGGVIFLGDLADRMYRRLKGDGSQLALRVFGFCVLCGFSVLTYRDAGYYGHERTLLAHTLEQNPTTSFGWYILGVSYYRDGEESQAERSFEKAASLSTSETMAQYNLSVLAAKRNDFAKAEVLVRGFLKDYPHYPFALDLLGRITDMHGNFDEALQLYNLARKYYPEIPAVKNGYCELYQRHGRLSEVADFCR